MPSAGGANAGRIYNIKKVDASANIVTIQASGEETIDGASSRLISTQYASYTVHSTGLEWFII